MMWVVVARIRIGRTLFWGGIAAGMMSKIANKAVIVIGNDEHVKSGCGGQEQTTEWIWTYNEGPNMGIGGITPAMKLKTAA